MAATVAARNKQIRQDSLRDMLRGKGLVEQVIVTAKKLEEQHKDLKASAIQALRASADLRMKLINKYLPDLKQTDIQNLDQEGLPADNKFTVEFLKAKGNE